jgi:F0F1-type ATP synthase membrane subunit a
MPAGLDDELAATETMVDEARESVEDNLRQRRAADQSLIAYTVVFVFVGLLVILTIATMDKDWATWKEPATFLLTMITSALLPVVTLVIGYYFGKEKQDK